MSQMTYHKPTILECKGKGLVVCSYKSLQDVEKIPKVMIKFHF